MPKQATQIAAVVERLDLAVDLCTLPLGASLSDRLRDMLPEQIYQVEGLLGAYLITTGESRHERYVDGASKGLAVSPGSVAE